MRNLVLPLLALLSALPLSAQEKSTFSTIDVLKDLKIPVELAQTVKSDKVHPGDTVKFHMAEPILVGKGVVIPANAKLYGHVVRSGLGRSGTRYVLSLVLDRAEWKEHVLALNAYVSGWGRRKRIDSLTADCSPTMPSSRGRRDPLASTNKGTSTLPPDCERSDTNDDLFDKSFSLAMSGVEIYHNPRDGSTVLVSSKNIHLPGGILLMFRNIDQPSMTATGAPSTAEEN